MCIKQNQISADCSSKIGKLKLICLEVGYDNRKIYLKIKRFVSYQEISYKICQVCRAL